MSVSQSAAGVALATSSEARVNQEGPRTWMQYVFGIGEEHVETAQPKSRLIYPLSVFGISWIAMTAVFLAYTAVVTPPVISLHWTDPDCAIIPTLEFDTLIDCFFLIDIVINFNTGILLIGEYIDDHKTVATSYLKGMFWFDLVTSFPVSFFELAAKAACERAEDSGAQVDSGQLRFIRAIKPLRWFKIARIMKLGKAGPIINLLMDYWNISPKQGKTFKVMVMLVMTIHILGCMWWLWKVLGMTLDEVNDFLDAQAWGKYTRHHIDTATGKLEAYAICIYVVTMTLTTVGYGDISADNTAERVGYVILFIVGAFIWGNLLAELGEIHASTSARHQEKMEKIQKTLEFLIENDCPRKLRTEIIQWTRFTEEHHDANVQKKKMIDGLPANLQKGLVRHLYSHEVSRVPVFAYIESVDDSNVVADAIQEHFLNEIFILFEYKTYVPGENIVNFSDEADKLIIFVNGKVTVEFEHSSIHRPNITLKDGDFIGDMALLGEQDWAASTCFHFPPTDTDEYTEIMVKTHPNEYVVVLQLTVENFKSTLEKSSVVTQAAVDQFYDKWKRSQLDIKEETDVSAMYRMRAIRNWEGMAMRVKKVYHQASAMEEHSEWDFAKHFSKFNKKKTPIGSRVQEGDALLSDTEAIMSPKKPVVSAGGISAGTGGVQSIVQLDAKVDKVLEAVNDMQARVLSLALAHSLSHVQTMERMEALAARVEAIAPGPPATDKPPAYTLPKLPPIHTPGSVRSYSRPGETPSFLTQSLEVELSLEEELRHLRSPAHKGSLHAGAREDVTVTGTKPGPGQIVNGGAA